MIRFIQSGRRHAMWLPVIPKFQGRSIFQLLAPEVGPCFRISETTLGLNICDIQQHLPENYTKVHANNSSGLWVSNTTKTTKYTAVLMCQTIQD